VGGYRTGVVHSVVAVLGVAIEPIGAQPEPSGLVAARAADDHIKKGHSVLFADHPVLIADAWGFAVLANEFHNGQWSNRRTHRKRSK
jgi:hypothetical protein